MEPEKQQGLKNPFSAKNMKRWYFRDLKRGKMLPKRKHEVIKPKISSTKKNIGYLFNPESSGALRY
jgi:hypothetical protein